MRNDESFLLEKRQHIWQPGGFVLQFAVLWSHSAQHQSWWSFRALRKVLEMILIPSFRSYQLFKETWNSELGGWGREQPQAHGRGTGLGAGWSILSLKMKLLLAGEGPPSAGMKMCASLPMVSHGNWDLTLCVKVFPTEIDDFFFLSCS